MNLSAREITVSGLVQGVWFRKYTCDKARELGLKGTVQNLDSGQVFIHAEGKTELLNALEEWCWQGSPQSKVENVASKSAAMNDHSSFEIIE